MVAPVALLLAHQGGWDEILMVAGPLVVVGALLILANRRAKQALADQLATEAAVDRSSTDLPKATGTIDTAGTADRETPRPPR